MTAQQLRRCMAAGGDCQGGSQRPTAKAQVRQRRQRGGRGRALAVVGAPAPRLRVSFSSSSALWNATESNIGNGWVPAQRPRRWAGCPGNTSVAPPRESVCLRIPTLQRYSEPHRFINYIAPSPEMRGWRRCGASCRLRRTTRRWPGCTQRRLRCKMASPVGSNPAVVDDHRNAWLAVLRRELPGEA